MKQLLLGAALVGIDTVIGALSSDNTNTGTANAEFAPPSSQSGDALWHLPKGLVNNGGSYTLTMGEQLRVIWTR